MPAQAVPALRSPAHGIAAPAVPATARVFAAHETDLSRGQATFPHTRAAERRLVCA
jgi:hypothetical protein